MNPWQRWQQVDANAEPAWRWLADLVAMPALLATPARPFTDMGEPPRHLSDVARSAFTSLLGPDRVKEDLITRSSHGNCATADRLRIRIGDLSRIPDAVLYPSTAEEVLTLLRLCASSSIAVVPYGTGSGFEPLADRSAHQGLVTIDLSGLNHLLSVDTLSGLAQAEAGIKAENLARQLASRGLMIHGPIDGSLGGYIARNPQTAWLEAVTLATPQGLLGSALGLAQGSKGRLGIITQANLRVGTLVAKTEYRRYLFPDFAAGVAALREAQRQGLERVEADLLDADQTRFYRLIDQVGKRRSMTGLLSDLYRHIRQFDQHAAQLTIGISGNKSETDAMRRRVDALAKRLGALALGPGAPFKVDFRDMLLDRGLSMDRIEINAIWSKLPSLYASLRNILDRAMRAHVPRAGAHGLVMGQICNANYAGAKLCLTIVYPRMLGHDVEQALAIRHMGLEALTKLIGPDDTLDLELRQRIKEILDPTAIFDSHSQTP